MPKKDDKLIVYEKFVMLIYYSKNLLNKFPKSERFDLCADIKQILYKDIRHILYAWKEYNNSEKLKHLRAVDIDLMVLKALIRIAYKYQYISQKNYMTWNENVSEIGRLIGGWMKVCPKE